jgi:hypothetical protein
MIKKIWRTMTRQIKHKFQCRCGESFEETVYDTVNVTVNPEMKSLDFLKRLNIIQCPHCHEEADIKIPFIYHDMDKKFWIWVYPEEAIEYKEEVLAEVEKQVETVFKIAPNSAIQDYKVFFGKAELIDFLLEQDPLYFDKKLTNK